MLTCSSIGGLDLNDGAWGFVLEDLRDEETESLTDTFHIIICESSLDVCDTNVQRCVLVLIA